MEQPVDKALIRKFIDGHCTPEEMARVGKFLEQPGSDQLFEEILNERWTNDDAPFDEVQMQRWQLAFSQKVAQLAPKKRKLPSYFKYAAVLAALIITSITWYAVHKSHTPAAVVMLENSTTAGKLLKLQLPDGTTVYLNAASRLQYPEKFTGSTRTVVLHGEAFFDVKQDKQHPFIVTADQLHIQVLGTSFNVRSYQNDEDIAVTVATGKVGVALGNTPAQILLPDQAFTYSKHSGNVQVNAADAAESRAWETGSFIFHYETLENITKRLSRWYDVDFVCTDRQLLQKRFKLKLKNERLQHVMESLSAAGSGFTYEIKGKQVIIH